MQYLQMNNSFDGKILEEAASWIKSNQKVVLATVIKTWGSSPNLAGSRMIINEKGGFSGSVSGGCVENSVISESIDLIKKGDLFKKLEFKVSNNLAWEVGLACGGEIIVYIERINLKIEILQEIIKKKISKKRFAVLTNLISGNSEIFELGKQPSKEFETSKKDIENYYKSNVNGIIEGTQTFIINYIIPIKIIIVGAVHIAQYLVDFVKSLNFEIIIIDPRKYFTTEKRFKNVKILNEWPNEALKKIEKNSNTALVTLTHDPKIDDPALQYALINKFFYIGALGSKKTHAIRCQRLKEAGFKDEEIESIHGPIGIKLGGKTSPEIALSIIAQIVSESYNI